MWWVGHDIDRCINITSDCFINSISTACSTPLSPSLAPLLPFTYLAAAVHLEVAAVLEGEGLVAGTRHQAWLVVAGNPHHLEEGRELAGSPAEAVESQEVEQPSQIDPF